VIGRLDLEGIEVIWGRLGDEELDLKYAGRPFDGIISRAALSASEVLRLGRRILKPRGTVLLMLGAVDKEQRIGLEAEATNEGRRVVEFSPYRLPGHDRARNLVMIR
jgi:16S rRNA G527 N7-methylase RsmG